MIQLSSCSTSLTDPASSGLTGIPQQTSTLSASLTAPFPNRAFTGVRNGMFVSPKFMCWSSNFLCDDIWRWSLQEIIRYRLSFWDYNPHDRISTLISRGYQSSLALPAYALFPSPKGGHREKVATWKPGRELSSELDHIGTVCSNYQSPKSWENKFLLFNLFSVQYFVVVAWTD